MVRANHQILRLRARPTRKTSGSEEQGGHSAQDDSSVFVSNPGKGLRFHRLHLLNLPYVIAPTT
jgi:hypothetical protein